MSIFKSLVFAGLAATVSIINAESHCPGNVDSLNLRLVQSSLIVVPVEINHTGPYDFVVDTGAQVSTIEPALASELHLKAEGNIGVAGVATYARTPYAYLKVIGAGEHSVPNTLAVIQDLTQLKEADSRIRGILGANFLEHFDVLIDNIRQILCLDGSGDLASTIKSEHITMAEPRGEQLDLPFTRPVIVPARLSGNSKTPLLLRLDSGSNAPLLYANPNRGKAPIDPATPLKRVVNGVEQGFAVLPPQDIRIGKHSVRQVAFFLPLNAVGGTTIPREDGLLPTIAFQRVFISCSGGYVALEPW
jgi:Aspartyl protease